MTPFEGVFRLYDQDGRERLLAPWSYIPIASSL
jgi:hypothetical protein